MSNLSIQFDFDANVIVITPNRNIPMALIIDALAKRCGYDKQIVQDQATTESLAVEEVDARIATLRAEGAVVSIEVDIDPEDSKRKVLRITRREIVDNPESPEDFLKPFYEASLANEFLSGLDLLSIEKSRAEFLLSLNRG